MLRSVVSLPIFLLLLSLDRKEGLLFRCLRLLHGGQKVLYKKGDDFPPPTRFTLLPPTVCLCIVQYSHSRKSSLRNKSVDKISRRSALFRVSPFPPFPSLPMLPPHFFGSVHNCFPSFLFPTSPFPISSSSVSGSGANNGTRPSSSPLPCIQMRRSST